MDDGYFVDVIAAEPVVTPVPDVVRLPWRPTPLPLLLGALVLLPLRRLAGATLEL